MLGQAIQVGTDPGAKSLILSNDVGALHLAANPAAGTITVNLPTGAGTIGLITAISAGTTLVSIGQVVLSNSNGVSFGMNGGTITATVQPGAAAGIAAIQAGTQTQTSGTNVLSNSNGISFGMSGSSQITASADYVRSISAGTTNATGNQLILSNSNGVSFGANGATITANVDAIMGISAGGASTNDVTVVFSNSNGLSFGLNAATVTASADYVRSISAGTTNATGNQLVFSNSNGISFGANGATITAKMPSLSFLDTPRQAGLASGQVIGSSNVQNLSLQRFSVPMQISATQADMLAHLTVAASTQGSYTLSIALYTFNASTIGTASSTSVGYTWSSGAATASNAYGGQASTRWRSIPLGTWNLTPGEYMLGFMVSLAGVAGTTGSMTHFGGSSVSFGANGPGIGGLVYTGYWMDHVYVNATAAFPSTIQLSQMSGNEGTQLRQPYIRFMGSF